MLLGKIKFWILYKCGNLWNTESLINRKFWELLDLRHVGLSVIFPTFIFYFGILSLFTILFMGNIYVHYSCYCSHAWLILPFIACEQIQFLFLSISFVILNQIFPFPTKTLLFILNTNPSSEVLNLTWNCPNNKPTISTIYPTSSVRWSWDNMLSYHSELQLF